MFNLTKQRNTYAYDTLYAGSWHSLFMQMWSTGKPHKVSKVMKEKYELT
jgi:hypothetical protein